MDPSIEDKVPQARLVSDKNLTKATHMHSRETSTGNKRSVKQRVSKKHRSLFTDVRSSNIEKYGMNHKTLGTDKKDSKKGKEAVIKDDTHSSCCYGVTKPPSKLTSDRPAQESNSEPVVQRGVLSATDKEKVVQPLINNMEDKALGLNQYTGVTQKQTKLKKGDSSNPRREYVSYSTNRDNSSEAKSSVDKESWLFEPSVTPAVNVKVPVPGHYTYVQYSSTLSETVLNPSVKDKVPQARLVSYESVTKATAIHSNVTSSDNKGAVTPSVSQKHKSLLRDIKNETVKQSMEQQLCPQPKDEAPLATFLRSGEERRPKIKKHAKKASAKRRKTCKTLGIDITGSKKGNEALIKVDPHPSCWYGTTKPPSKLTSDRPAQESNSEPVVQRGVLSATDKEEVVQPLINNMEDKVLGLNQYTGVTQKQTKLKNVDSSNPRLEYVSYSSNRDNSPEAQSSVEGAVTPSLNQNVNVEQSREQHLCPQPKDEAAPAPFARGAIQRSPRSEKRVTRAWTCRRETMNHKIFGTDSTDSKHGNEVLIHAKDDTWGTKREIKPHIIDVFVDYHQGLHRGQVDKMSRFLKRNDKTPLKKGNLLLQKPTAMNWAFTQNNTASQGQNYMPKPSTLSWTGQRGHLREPPHYLTHEVAQSRTNSDENNNEDGETKSRTICEDKENLLSVTNNQTTVRFSSQMSRMEDKLTEKSSSDNEKPLFQKRFHLEDHDKESAVKKFGTFSATRQNNSCYDGDVPDCTTEADEFTRSDNGNPVTTISDMHSEYRRDLLSRQTTAAYSVVAELDDFKGVALILNYVNFPSAPHLTQRVGAEHDESKVKDLFESLNYHVIIRKDQTKEETMETIQYHSQLDHSNYKAFMCFIFSHGSNGNIYCSDGGILPLSHIFTPFESAMCPTLKGKPKAFFIQACLGSQVLAGTTDASPLAEETEIVAKPNLPACADADFLLSYATLPGHAAIRTEEGSPYVNFLVKYIRQYSDGLKKKTLLDIMTIVNEALKNFTVLDQESQISRSCRQAGSVVETLTKAFYLRANKRTCRPTLHLADSD